MDWVSSRSTAGISSLSKSPEMCIRDSITAVCTKNLCGDPKMTTYFKLDETGRINEVLDCPNSPEGYESLKVYVLSTAKLVELVDYCASHNLYSFTTSVLLGMVDKLNIQPYFYDGYVARLTTIASYYARSKMCIRDRPSSMRLRTVSAAP